MILCSEKYLWYDEFFTLYVCRLQGLRAMWSALKHGVDFNPPLFYVVTNLSKILFGENRYALRFPAMAGFWVFCVCLFRFVSRRTNPGAGFAAMVFPTLTGAVYYACEARPYGPLLGFCGLALICWQMTLDSPRRHRWFIAFGLSLSGALMMHCYAVLLVFPFAVVELLRSIHSRRFDWRIWAALTLPTLASSIMYLPLLGSFGSLSQGTTLATLAPPTWDQIPDFYSFFLSPCILVLLAVVIALSFNATIRSPRASVQVTESESGTVLELILATAFLMLPIVELVLVQRIHGLFLARYSIAAVAGLSLIIGLQGRRGNRRHRRSLILALLMGSVAIGQLGFLISHRYRGRVEMIKEPSSGFSMNMSLTGPLAQYSLLSSRIGDSQPIGILWPIDFLYLANYDPSLLPRMYYVKGTSQDFFGPGLQNLRPWSPVHFNAPLTREEFLRLAPHSVVYGLDHSDQLRAFLDLGGAVKSLGESDGHFVAEIQSPAPPH